MLSALCLEGLDYIGHAHRYPHLEGPCFKAETHSLNKYRVGYITCHQYTATCPYFIAAFFLGGVATISKEFLWYLVHDVTSVCLCLVFFSFLSL
jgi:hypothetical protein